jgi:hypothetical protein
MKNIQQKRGASIKQKSPKLRLNKRTLKDLDAKQDPRAADSIGPPHAMGIRGAAL